MAQFKTLQFPNTAAGQADKIRALEQHTAQGWRVVSETIISGKFDTQKAACYWFLCGPLCALTAGHKDDTIQITLELPDGSSQIQKVSSSLTGATVSYDRSRWNALLQFDKDIFAASEELRPLGQKWSDELASSYMTLNDKSYLSTIVQNIRNAATAEREEAARVTAEDEARRQATAAEQEARRKAAEAAKEKKRKAREENAVFWILSRNELIAACIVLLFIAGGAIALSLGNNGTPSAPAAPPTPLNATIQSTPQPQAPIIPSFDCTRVQSAVLKLVCSTPELADLDRQLASAYSDALTKAPSPEALRAEERIWIRDRNNSDPDVEKIRAMYQSRIAALKEISATPQPTAPAANDTPTNSAPLDQGPNSSPSSATSAQGNASPPPTTDAPNSPGQQGHYYYCDPLRAYYPRVSSCPAPWRAVDPQRPSSGGTSQ